MPAAGAAGGTLRGDPATNARTGDTQRLAHAGAARTTLCGQTASALLAGDAQLRRLRRSRLGGAAGAGTGRLPDGAGDVLVGPPRGRRTSRPGRRPRAVPVGALRLPRPDAGLRRVAMLVHGGGPGDGARCPDGETTAEAAPRLVVIVGGGVRAGIA